MALPAHPLNMEFYFVDDYNYGCARLLFDNDNIVPFKNITPINQTKKLKIKERRAN